MFPGHSAARASSHTTRRVPLPRWLAPAHRPLGAPCSLDGLRHEAEEPYPGHIFTCIYGIQRMLTAVEECNANGVRAPPAKCQL
eukprot:5402135-Prymnesium_polylepis.1